MKFNKTVSTIVITYEDLECVKYKNEHARKFQDFIRQIYHGYRAAVIAGLVPGNTDFLDIETEVIRNGLTDNEIVRM